MSLMDRFKALAAKARSNGLDKDMLKMAFYGSSMEGFDNGKDDIKDVIVWDEEPQSAILFLSKDWDVVGFSWVDEENPDSEWSDSPEMSEFFSSCIAYAKENRICLDEVGVRDAEVDDGTKDASDSEVDWDCILAERVKNLLVELRTTIEGNYCSMDDIAYVEMMDRNGHTVCISPASFAEMASKIEYKNGRHEATIHDDLKVVLKDGSFIGRMWADGSEWFRFYEKPNLNPNIVELGRDELCFFNSDMDRKEIDFE